MPVARPLIIAFAASFLEGLAWRLRPRTLRVVAFVPLLIVPAAAQTPHGTVRGEVYSLSPAGERYMIQGAEVVLSPVPGLHPPGPTPVERTTTSDQQGKFLFEKVLVGCYRATAQSAGLEGLGDQLCLVGPGGSVDVVVEMAVDVMKQSVDVSAGQAPTDMPGIASTQAIETATLMNAPTVSERFENLLPLIPGVVRGPDNRINLKGTRAAQSGLLVNSVNVTDPVTGASAINLPVDIVTEVTVLSNPYDAQYGQFAGAVTTVSTQVSDFRKFRFKLQNPVPSPRRREGSFVGIDSFMPRLTLSAPLRRGRVALTQSLEYRFVRTEIKQAGLPPLESDTEIESFDSFTQADLQIHERHTTGISFSLYPQKQDYFGLSTFLPRSATPNLRQRGFLVGVQDNYALRSGSLLSSRVHFKRFEADVRANSLARFRDTLESAEGGFFNRQNRRTWQAEVGEIFHFAPQQVGGQHFLKAGFNYSHLQYDGRQIFDTVDILGISDRLVQRIFFEGPASVGADQNEYTLFLQDRWLARPRLTLDLGLRFDRDSITGTSNPAPRFGFAYLLTSDNKTVLRGGAGVFYDRVDLAIPTFLDLPERTETLFTPGGATALTRAYAHRLARAGFRNPRSVGWTTQIDRELAPNWFLRLGYQQRVTTQNFFLNPEVTPEGAFLTLASDGRDRYRELEITTRHQLGRRHHWTASYIRSSAVGDLNDFNSVFGNVGHAVIRPNERSRLAFDAPNRFLFWADLSGPYDLLIAPVVDIHTGFPYSVVDEQRDFVGPRNRTGEFPRFAAVDLQVLREIRLPIKDGFKARVGVRIFNLLNSFNPLDVQNILVSPRFGAFSNTRERAIRAKFSLDF